MHTWTTREKVIWSICRCSQRVTQSQTSRTSSCVETFKGKILAGKVTHCDLHRGGHNTVTGRSCSSWFSSAIRSWWTSLSCCWSSLFSRASTAFASLFLRIAVWIAFFCLDDCFWTAGWGFTLATEAGPPTVLEGSWFSVAWFSGRNFLRMGFDGGWEYGMSWGLKKKTKSEKN